MPSSSTSRSPRASTSPAPSHFERSGDYVGARGGGIGQALPGALGVKLAHPDRPVVAVSGDGSAMYSIQALWTAAHHDLAVVFVILNNREYRILKHNMDTYRQRFGAKPERGYPNMDLVSPDLGFVDMARGMGVEAARVDQAGGAAPGARARRSARAALSARRRDRGPPLTAAAECYAPGPARRARRRRCSCRARCRSARRIRRMSLARISPRALGTGSPEAW